MTYLGAFIAYDIELFCSLLHILKDRIEKESPPAEEVQKSCQQLRKISVYSVNTTEYSIEYVLEYVLFYSIELFLKYVLEYVNSIP